jgi:type IV pilus modification protein PilV
MEWPTIDRIRGFSLIELSVATAVFSIGLSSLSLMMLTAVRGTDDAHHLTLAEIQADKLAEFIAMNPGAVGHFVNPPTAVPLDCVEQDCAPEAMAGAMMSAWRQQLTDTLPAASGLVCRDRSIYDGSPANGMCDGAGNLVIKIWWSDENVAADEESPQGHVTRLQW